MLKIDFRIQNPLNHVLCNTVISIYFEYKSYQMESLSFNDKIYNLIVGHAGRPVV